MKQSIPNVTFMILATVTTSAIADEVRMPSTPREESASVVQVQPRARHFVPHSKEEEDIQRKLTIFNSTQQILDAEFDKKLTICRRC